MILNKLILGSAQFGTNYGVNNKFGKISNHEVFKILSFAYKNNIKKIDTAASYGEAEFVIGEYLKKHRSRNFEITTKFKIDIMSCEESLLQSLKILNVDKIDTIMFHSFDDYLKSKNELPEFSSKYVGKKFNKIGVSIYKNFEIQDLLQDENIKVIQAPFNLLDNESKRSEIYRKAKDHNKILNTRSVFLQGLFFMNPDILPPKLILLKNEIIKIHSLASKYNISIESLALRYALSKKYIDGVLFGIDSLSQFENNIKNITDNFSNELIDEIDKISINENSLLNPTLWH